MPPYVPKAGVSRVVVQLDVVDRGHASFLPALAGLAGFPDALKLLLQVVLSEPDGERTSIAVPLPTTPSPETSAIYSKQACLPTLPLQVVHIPTWSPPPDTTPRSATYLSFDPQACAFIREHGLRDVADRALATVSECFPDVRTISVGVHVDPEIPDCQRLCIEAKVRAEVEEILKGEEAFDEAICSELNAQQRGLLVLLVRMAG